MSFCADPCFDKKGAFHHDPQIKLHFLRRLFCLTHKLDAYTMAVCYLPGYSWENIQGFSSEEINYFQELLESLAHVIIELAGEGGFEGGLEDAASF